MAVPKQLSGMLLGSVSIPGGFLGKVQASFAADVSGWAPVFPQVSLSQSRIAKQTLLRAEEISPWWWTLSHCWQLWLAKVQQKASKPAPATVLYFLVAIVCKKKCALDPIIIVTTMDLGELRVMIFFFFLMFTGFIHIKNKSYCLAGLKERCI